MTEMKLRHWKSTVNISFNNTKVFNYSDTQNVTVKKKIKF